MSGTPAEVIRERAGTPTLSRLHALWCHQRIRADLHDWEFHALAAQGFAVRRYDGPCLLPSQCDFVITSRGMNRAADLFT